jgi:hypothetical protein
MDMRSQPPLRLDSREILDVVAEEPTQILDEPVEQRGEVQRVAGRPLVVVDVRAGGGAVGGNPAVAVTRQRDEHRRPECLAVSRGVRPADRPGRDCPARQVGGVLATPGRAVTAFGPSGQDIAPDARPGDLLVQISAQLVQVARVIPGRFRLVAPLLGLGAVLDPHELHVIRVVRGNDRLGVKVPTLTALRSPQVLGPLGAGGADSGESVPARDEYRFDATGLQVRAA